MISVNVQYVSRVTRWLVAMTYCCRPTAAEAANAAFLHNAFRPADALTG